MNKLQRVYFFEVLLYAIILVTAFSVPFLSGIYAKEGWKSVLHDWSLLSLFAVVFLINNFILVPRLLFKERYLYYLLACVLLVISTAFFSPYLFELTHPGRPPFGAMHGNIAMRDSVRERAYDRMPDRARERIPDRTQDSVYDRMPDKMRERMPGRTKPMPPNARFEQEPGRKPPPHFRGDMPRKYPIHGFFNFGVAFISFLLIGFNTGVKSFVRWSEVQVRQAEKEKQYLYTELSFLKHQISPHFFMNTLNNIHSLMDINSEEAKNAIIKLSRLMRYLLYESDVQTVALSKEIEFMKSYIELMRLRYDEESLTVEVEYPENTDEVAVPSFLFFSFIENAFKHGISLYKHSFIDLRFSIESNLLIFSVRNSISDNKPTMSEASGIGLENVRKRLNLIYQDRYFLRTTLQDDYHEVILKIPI